MEPDSTPCPALKSFIDYWDQWHKEWYLQVKSTPQKLTSINGWPIPEGNGGNTNDIWRYFPEPYWGNPFPTELTAVFLNLNPGKGGDGQDIKISTKDPIDTYNSKNQVYSETVIDLIKNPCYPTTGWLISQRVFWLNCLLKNLGMDHDKTISNIISGDLVPWHTKTVSEIKPYIDANISLIEKYCIKPLADISQCAKLEGVVLCRGVEVAHVLKKITKEKVCYKLEKKCRIHIYEYNNAVFVVFVHEGDMNLPNPNKMYPSPISIMDVSVSDIIKGCLAKKYI